jgi:hypothetical protein
MLGVGGSDRILQVRLRLVGLKSSKSAIRNLHSAIAMSILIAEDNVAQRRPRRIAGKRGVRPGVNLVLLVSVLLNSACAARAVSSQANLKSPTPMGDSGTAKRARVEIAKEEVQIADAFVDRDREELTYEGYTVRRRYKKVRIDYPPEMKEPAETVEVSYAVLERKGKVLASFDAGVYHGGLNSTSFGLFSFLGDGEKQLIISQDAPREGRQWVVSLSPRFRVIYDGAAFVVGRESDDMSVVDLDGDGVYEIIAPVCHFYGFHDWALAPMATPLPEVIFKYDTKAGKYLPANERFQEYLLRDMDKVKAKVHGPADRESHLADILSIVVNYVFAGKEREAWQFYEAEYKLPDKVEIKKEIKDTLKSQPVYRFMYGKTARL